ncbi:MAG: UvrB/UvrC motif-containing protein [Nitrospinae bacterium]|nr:UvrB/UvrC motif-containing protein [Nitrospinota bacterium]
MVAFDGKNEAFYWNGNFEESKAMYSINAETGYACLKLEKEGAALNIYQYERDIFESRITSMVPYKLELNGRTVYNTSLLKESGEKKLIYEILKDYFKRGVKRNAEFLSPESQESINALIFGYHTFQRFKAYIKESYPDFCQEIENYKRRSLKDSLSLFQPGEKTEDELEIEIKKAVFEEDYERAARIRDQLKKLNQPGSPKSMD